VDHKFHDAAVKDNAQRLCIEPQVGDVVGQQMPGCGLKDGEQSEEDQAQTNEGEQWPAVSNDDLEKSSSSFHEQNSPNALLIVYLFRIIVWLMVKRTEPMV
jgi:hypothetical protein